MSSKEPLSVTHPEIAKEADGWDPSLFTAGSGKKVKWKCPNGHVYEALIASRTGSKTKCGICSGNRVLIGFNDFASTFPELAKEVLGWDATQFSSGSGKRQKWLCQNGHIYEASIVSRTSRKSGCPVCSNNKVLVGYNDLASTHPKLASEAYGWDPTTLKSMSGKSVSWKCEKGHIFQSIVANRSKGIGCGVCANHVIISGTNDLATLYPKIAVQANGWDPTTVGAGSHKRLPWKCKEGHTWETSPKHRVNGTNCPVCDGQKIVFGVNDLATTHPELAGQAFGWDPKITLAKHHQKYSWKCEKGHIWEASITARKGGSGCLVCTGKQVEVDYNSLSFKYPEIAKQAYGWDPKNEFAGGSSKKFTWKCSSEHIWKSTISNRTGKNSGCPICSNQQLLAGFNDLATTHPDLALQADGWDSSTKIAGSNKRFSWKCSMGHTWDAVLASRAHGGSDCPFCSGVRVWPGFNDLMTTHPEIAKDASGWDPTSVSFGSITKLLWKCQLGHLYKARINHRATGVSSCHFCSGHRVLKGFNDLETNEPKLALEAHLWDPSSVTCGIQAKRKWKCAEGHVWTTSVNSRTGIHRTGCPTCTKSGFDPNSKGYIYFLDHPNWEMFQIGITNVPDDRLGRHKRLGWEVLELRGPMDGHLTQQWETAILRMVKNKGADLSNAAIAGKFDGYSEAWSKSTFGVSSIKELMRLTDEFEEEELRKAKKSRK